jgi:hypothetical protein
MTIARLLRYMEQSGWPGGWRTSILQVYMITSSRSSILANCMKQVIMTIARLFRERAQFGLSEGVRVSDSRLHMIASSRSSILVYVTLPHRFLKTPQGLLRLLRTPPAVLQQSSSSPQAVLSNSLDSSRTPQGLVRDSPQESSQESSRSLQGVFEEPYLKAIK